MENTHAKKGFFEGPPQTMFVFGIAVGIAVTIVVALLLGGFNPSTERTVRANTTNPTPTAAATQPTPSPAAPAGTIAEVTEDDHVRGNLKKAKVVMVEYSDFECPFCSRHHPVMQQALDEYGDDVAWVYRHFPLSFHPNAQPAAVASECAAEQGKFWEMGDALFENQNALGTATYERIAGEIGLDLAAFQTCMSSGDYDAKIAAHQADGAQAGATGTPATFINGQLVSGALPYAQIQSIIESAL